jgi:hypothetical protein
MTRTVTGKRALWHGVHLYHHAQRQALGKDIYRLDQEGPWGGLPKPHLPRQAQTQGLQHEPSFMTSGSLTWGAEPDEGPDRSEATPFPEENTVMMVFGGCP